MEITMHPIGVIHSPFREKRQTPIQASRSRARGEVVLDPKYLDGLQDLEGFSHIFLLYAFNYSSGYRLRVKPFLDDKERGLFATRYPCRPNPIGISIVRLLSREENILLVEGVDVMDKTPLLDIKPYVPDFDVRGKVQVGWYKTRSKK